MHFAVVCKPDIAKNTVDSDRSARDYRKINGTSIVRYNNEMRFF